METILTLGIPLNVGSAYTLSSQALLTLLGSPDTLLSRFFFFSALFYYSQINGGFLSPQPSCNLHNVSSQHYTEHACSRILVLTSGYTLKSLREFCNMSIPEPYLDFQIQYF